MFSLQRMLKPFVKPDAAMPSLTPDQIIVLANLEKLRQKRTFVYLGIGKSGAARYQSIILDIDYAQARFTIDEPFQTKTPLHEGDMVNVSIRESDTHSLAFITRVHSVNRDNDGTEVILDCPDHLDEQQRRGTFRLPIPGRASWQNDDDPAVNRARVEDISLGGVKLALPLDGMHHLRPGTALENCQLEFSTMSLNCDLEITRVETDSGIPERSTIGARMLTIDPLERRKLEQFLMQQQRRLRNRAG